MGKIDDPYDATKSQYLEESENLFGELALHVAGAVIPLVGVFNAIRDHFSQAAVAQRLRALVEAVNSKIDSVQRRVEGNQEQIAAMRSKVESPQFRAAVRLAMEETWRTDEARKIKRFAAILGNSVAPNDELDVSEDVSDFIRAVAQLGERDIQAVQILYSVFADVVKVYPNLHDPNVFTERAGQLLKKVDESKIHRDDFYSYCKRLEGFGLAIEVPRNIGRMAPGDYCFRPTRRGLKLLLLLEEYDNAQQTAAAV